MNPSILYSCGLNTVSKAVGNKSQIPSMLLAPDTSMYFNFLRHILGLSAGSRIVPAIAAEWLLNSKNQDCSPLPSRVSCFTLCHDQFKFIKKSDWSSLVLKLSIFRGGMDEYWRVTDSRVRLLFKRTK